MEVAVASDGVFHKLVQINVDTCSSDLTTPAGWDIFKWFAVEVADWLGDISD